MLRKGLLKQGRNKVSAYTPGSGRCNPGGDRLTHLGNLQFMLHLFQSKDKGKNFLLSVGLLSLRGEKSFAKTDKAVVLFFFGSELAVVILKENPISGRPWGQFFDHLINFALVTLLGSVLSELKEVEDFLAFFRTAGFSGFFSCQVVTDSSFPCSKKTSCASGLDRSVSGLCTKPPKMLNSFILRGRRFGSSREGFFDRLG